MSTQLSNCCKAKIELTGEDRPNAFKCQKCGRIIGTPITFDKEEVKNKFLRKFGIEDGHIMTKFPEGDYERTATIDDVVSFFFTDRTKAYQAGRREGMEETRKIAESCVFHGTDGVHAVVITQFNYQKFIDHLKETKE